MGAQLLVSVALLAAVLVMAVARPAGLPEAVGAVPAALIALATGLVGLPAALAELARLAPTVGFLAAVLALGHLADTDGVFTWVGRQVARVSAGRPRRLFALVVVTAATTTAFLSLDATVVLLTPVVVATARRERLARQPHVYACGHLANSASTLLPMSNLTNLLALSASKLTFLGFAGLMALPWVTAVAVEYAVLAWWFGGSLAAPASASESSGPAPATPAPGAAGAEPGAPRFALIVLACTLAGFAVTSAVGVEPVWPAAAGAAALGVRALVRRRITPLRLLGTASPLFCLFVLAVGVVVIAVGTHGLSGALATLLPTVPTLGGLLVTAAVAAVLANLVNNLPATLLLLGVLGPHAPPGLVLAMLLGVNIGPNLTYAGSLATLLWRNVLRAAGEPVRLTEFSAVGALAVPATLTASVVALWAVL
ncbi:ArsB/NhaD family transporter [Pseudonocardia aurantiaca]|uniref:SLC13 family permease n=1 Tax=Pseudonocardia aurantiaca TaxID=75290 RepID=A0ABW4FLK0_9PSEU